MELTPISIAVIAPTKTGKTSLLSTVVDYIKSKTNEAEGYSIVVDEDADIEISDFKNKLDGQLQLKNIKFNSSLLDGTIECTPYSFSIVFNTGDDSEPYIQPFNVLDIPGAFVNNPAKAKKEYGGAFEQFEAHLKKSCILWIPIDAVVLMEAVGRQKQVSAELRCVSHVQDYAKKWAQQAKVIGKPSKANFVLVKSETYFSQDKLKQYKFCKQNFDADYNKVVKTIKDCNPETTISCVSVETIGSVKFTSARWSDDSIETNFKVTDKERVIRGAEYLLQDALSIAIESVNDNIKTQRESIERNKEIANQNIEDSDIQLDAIEENLKIINNSKEELLKELDNLDRRIRDYNDTIENGGFFAWLFGDKSRARENRRRAEAEVEKYTKQKVQIMQLLSKNNDDKSLVEDQKAKAQAVIDKAEKDIEALEKLHSQFEKLRPQSINSPYYRSL